jgi:hypothetical protein
MGFDRERAMLYRARAAAKASGIMCDLTVADIVIPAICPVLGIPLAWTVRGDPGYPTLDRIDNDRSYIRGNVAVISWRANQLKRDGSLADFRAIVAYMENGLGVQP